MIGDQSKKFANKCLNKLPDIVRYTIPAQVAEITEKSFANGAFWACEEILSALSIVWGIKLRDSQYLETLREIINRIERHKDERIVLEGTTEEKQAAPGNQRTKR